MDFDFYYGHKGQSAVYSVGYNEQGASLSCISRSENADEKVIGSYSSLFGALKALGFPDTDRKVNHGVVTFETGSEFIAWTMGADILTGSFAPVLMSLIRNEERYGKSHESQPQPFAVLYLNENVEAREPEEYKRAKALVDTIPNCRHHRAGHYINDKWHCPMLQTHTGLFVGVAGIESYLGL